MRENARVLRRLLIVLLAGLTAGCTVQRVDGTAAPSIEPASPPTSVSGSPSQPPASESIGPSGPTGSAEATESAQLAEPVLTEFAVPAGAHPHDVSPAADGGIWYSGQQNGTLGHLDPATGVVREIPLGQGSSPHGVITGPDEAAWITDSGLNAIVRVDAEAEEITTFPLPDSAAGANLNTAVFDPDGILWFTGQQGFYGRLDP